MWRLLRPDAQAMLSNKMATRSLNRYFAVAQNEKPAKFMISKKLPAQFSHEDPPNKLWDEHARLAESFRKLQKDIDSGRKSYEEIETPEKCFLDLEIEIAKRILSSCHLCTRECRVNRLENKTGYCRCGQEIAVSSIFEHMGEEPELVPSGTIFTMGCTIRCKHCQNYTISQWMEKGEIYTPENLARQVENLRTDGCRNANLVGGEPTPWLRQWLETFKQVNTNIPIVWNSNTYYSPETAQLLAGFADVYLLDFKYGPDECAGKVSDAPRYWETCTRNHLEAQKNGELIIRVLVLPSHQECCTKPTVDWIAQNLGRETRVNIMFQYRPEWRASEVPNLARKLSEKEKERTLAIVKEAGLTNFII